MFRKYILPTLVWWCYRVLTLTWRYTIVESPEFAAARKDNKPIILAHWHEHELALLPIVKHYGLATMTSTSKDGELINHVIHKFGGHTSRGSSTRGGVQALKGLIRLVKNEGRMVSMAVDGPKGPIHQVKHGVFEISKLANAGIVALAAASSANYVFSKSWNKAILPKPFARVMVHLSKPVIWVEKNDKERFPELSDTLAHEINASKAQAHTLLNR